MFNSPNTAAMMGTVAAAPPRDRRRRPGARAEHRRGDLDRVRARGRHLVGAEERPVQRVLRAGQPHLDRAADAVHLQHAHRAVVPGGDLAARRVVARGAAQARRRPRPRLPRTSARAVAASEDAAGAHERRSRNRAAADRRGGRAHRDHAADDPLLRGDRAARPAARPRPGQAPRATPRPTSSACARSSGCATCSGSRSTSCRSCSRPRARAPSSGASIAQTEDAGGTRADPRRGARPHRHAAELVRERRRELEQLERELVEQASGESHKRLAELRPGVKPAGSRRRPPRDGGAVVRPPVHRHRAGVDPGAAAVPDRRRTTSTTRRRPRWCSRRRSPRR